MAELLVKLILPGGLVRDPVIYQLAHDLGVKFSIEQGRFTERNAWILARMEGKRKLLAEAMEFLRSKGVRTEVQPATPGKAARGGKSPAVNRKPKQA
ncbi:MAG: hypothetical protein HYZ53_22705 [Planctomycetes bacterium]|nr:hypothetical protein [Planctomycetota bacterium]